jgi:septal ring factor EnvC (AmiA/AmiB activator)
MEQRGTSKAWAWLVGAAIVALAGAGLYFAYAADRNRDSADRWQKRAGTLERSLTARSRQLNTRTAALNKTAAALKRSEQDVRTLEGRQRELANEKAKVEDVRGALEIQAGSLARLAGEQRDCTTGLTELLNRYAAEDFEWVDANAATVGQACEQARADFAALESTGG